MYFKVDSPPPANSPPGDHVDHHGKGNRKKRVSKKKKKKKLVHFSHGSDADKNAADYEITCDFVKRANVVVPKQIFNLSAPGRTQLPTSRHLYSSP